MPPADFVLSSPCLSPSLHPGLWLWPQLSCIAVTMGWAQWDLSDRVCLLRLLISGWAATAALCCLPACVLVHAGHNVVIVSTIVLDRALHTPMPSSLVSSPALRLVTFVIVPKMLVDLLAQKKTISFLGLCHPDVFFLFLICSHSFLLAAMGYDRYVAICNPLRYTVLMGFGVCMGLVAAACACAS